MKLISSIIQQLQCNLLIISYLYLTIVHFTNFFEYYREYRTFFHIGLDYGLNESNVQRNIEKIEDILISSGYFRIQGKRILISNQSIKNIRIDVTECMVQRPNKSKKYVVRVNKDENIAVKRNAILERFK